jgi:pimeloyl-ACP methyl ester carboxylesterase
MRKALKKTIWVLAILVGLIWMTLVVLFVSTDIQILEPEEQQKLKADKQFWEWRSPYGPLAMHYVEKGEGDHHLLLLHGFRAHTFTWKAVIDPLAQAGYHVWAIDLIGYGLSDKPDNAVYSVDFFVQQVYAFMEAKGIAQAHLIGNSMGGGLALSLALSHPKCVQSLTLLSALGYPLDMPLYLSLGRHISQIWAPFLGPTMIRHCLKQIVCQSDKVTDEQVEAYSLPYRFPGGVAASLLTLQKFDNQRLVEMGQQYASLTYPTLIIWGDHDTLIPLCHYEKFIHDFPHAQTLLITNCGHIPQEEEPEQVLAAILQFLQKANPAQKEAELSKKF